MEASTYKKEHQGDNSIAFYWPEKRPKNPIELPPRIPNTIAESASASLYAGAALFMTSLRHLSLPDQDIRERRVNKRKEKLKSLSTAKFCRIRVRDSRFHPHARHDSRNLFGGILLCHPYILHLGGRKLGSEEQLLWRPED